MASVCSGTVGAEPWAVAWAVLLAPGDTTVSQPFVQQHGDGVRKSSQLREGSEAVAGNSLQHFFCVRSSPCPPAAHTQQVKSLCLLLPALSSLEAELQPLLHPQLRSQRTRDRDFSKPFSPAKANDG